MLSKAPSSQTLEVQQNLYCSLSVMMSLCISISSHLRGVLKHKVVMHDVKLGGLTLFFFLFENFLFAYFKNGAFENQNHLKNTQKNGTLMKLHFTTCQTP